MNRSYTLNRIALALAVGLAAFGSSAARADHYPRVDPADRYSAPSTLTRAQVVADLKAYQASGLAAAERIQLEQGYEMNGLRAARDRYAALTRRSTAAPAPLTRAEVLADLKIYQESGLAEAERVALEQGHDTAALAAARERYAALRQSDRYAFLVMQTADRIAQPARPSRGS
ncbi:DUF4148 domain-containing protein [Roseateles amylovorans]|uniref:DUF4148 domain-containing protein n=1 Tax=Roseateles amylovorans TaxID=2978473 RepID=A0ABY6ASF8_9BURK|nr:DUF4148 domain-containing protein [Roseateles amylovorans]UXH76169.1 DUF4148 domain-containing protein [Roseateles amylovorans]